MLLARPLLVGGKSKPRSRTILMIVTYCGMAGFKMFVRVDLLNERARIVSPLLIPITVEIVAHIPSDIGKRPKPIRSISNEAALILASCVGMHFAVIHIKHEGDNHVSIPRELRSEEHTSELQSP